MGILEVKDLNLSVNGNHILNGVSIDFWEGYVHAVVGPNGAGKSTLASTIMGLTGYREAQGEILFEGQSIRDLEVDERAKLGLTLGWQEPARFEGLKVRDFILSAAKNKTEDTLGNVLTRVGLRPSVYSKRAVDKTLSGGERKKVELASILAMEPRMVFLDEPDSGIDVESLNRIFDAVQALKDLGSTVILITHSLTVLRQSEHAFLLCHGSLVDKGPVDQIIQYFQGKCIPCDHKNQPEEEELNQEEVSL
jgi:Fe-S cluster assembly ATP-binding protein